MLISCHVRFELLFEAHIFFDINPTDKLFAGGCG